MKKYIICKTGEPVDIGDTLQGNHKISTSFGNLSIVKEILITKDNVSELISKRIIKVVEDSYDLNKVIVTLATSYNKTIEEVTAWLNKTNEICPKAVLDILLNEIAVRFYNDDPTAFEKAEKYYSLKPKDGTVGKVNILSPYLPLFKSIEDAEKARKILKKQLNNMYGETSS